MFYLVFQCIFVGVIVVEVERVARTSEVSKVIPMFDKSLYSQTKTNNLPTFQVSHQKLWIYFGIILNNKNAIFLHKNRIFLKV